MQGSKLRSRQGQAGATGRALSLAGSSCGRHICQKGKGGFCDSQQRIKLRGSTQCKCFNVEAEEKKSKPVSRSELEGREDANVAKEMRVKGTTMTPRVYRRRGLFATDVTGSGLAELQQPEIDGHVQKAVSE